MRWCMQKFLLYCPFNSLNKQFTNTIFWKTLLITNSATQILVKAQDRVLVHFCTFATSISFRLIKYWQNSHIHVYDIARIFGYVGEKPLKKLQGDVWYVHKVNFAKIGSWADFGSISIWSHMQRLCCVTLKVWYNKWNFTIYEFPGVPVKMERANICSYTPDIIFLATTGKQSPRMNTRCVQAHFTQLSLAMV